MLLIAKYLTLAVSADTCYRAHFTLPSKTPLLLLVSVDDDNKQFSIHNKNKAHEIEEIQNLPRRSISGREYFQFRCILSDVSDNECVSTGSMAGMPYTDARFQTDIKGGNAGFKVTFDGCEVTHHFNWRQVLKQPSSFMFFGVCECVPCWRLAVHRIWIPQVLSRMEGQRSEQICGHLARAAGDFVP